MQADYDINSDNIVASFRHLESKRYIASANTDRYGLSVSADGLSSWSVVDLYVTDEGLLFLESPPKPVTAPVKDWLIKSTIQNIVAWAVIEILAIAVAIYWPKVKETFKIREPVAGRSST